MTGLTSQQRPADGTAEGLLILHHGRGSNDRDLLGIADVLDPDRRLHVVTPRAPLTVEGWGGYHWYVVPRVGFPDHDTFHAALTQLGALHDELWASTGLTPSQTILGGFSMGAVMSYATGLSATRPAPAGLLPLAGFIPTVDGWAPSLDDRPGVRACIAHGRQDQIMEVGFGRRARDLLEGAGLKVEYHESDVGHTIDRAVLPAATRWVAATLGLDR